jgi:hypothetical protein
VISAWRVADEAKSSSPSRMASELAHGGATAMKVSIDRLRIDEKCPSDLGR